MLIWLIKIILLLFALTVTATPIVGIYRVYALNKVNEKKYLKNPIVGAVIFDIIVIMLWQIL